jgi:hypothetical protein
MSMVKFSIFVNSGVFLTKLEPKAIVWCILYK